MIQRMEDSPKPVVAAIHGSCLGGGSEVGPSTPRPCITITIIIPFLSLSVGLGSPWLSLQNSHQGSQDCHWSARGYAGPLARSWGHSEAAKIGLSIDYHHPLLKNYR